MQVDPVRLYLHVRIQFVNPHYRPVKIVKVIYTFGELDQLKLEEPNQ